MFLYNLSLQAPTTIGGGILGHFMGTKQQEIVVARQQRLELWKADTNTGKLSVIHSEDLFCRIRSIAPFRLTGSTRDYIALASDTGAAALLEFDAKESRFKMLQYHEFGRTGLRRIIPGQYVASDPRGRAIMVGGIERARLVYIINRDTEGNVMMGSPLEANKAHSICFDVVGVDVGYENPVFATIETNYSDVDQDPNADTEKLLVYYELDLGLNHVVRKWSTGISKTANKLIALPGSSDGPSGVLVCSEGFIEYKHNLEAAREHRVPIPRRVNPLEDAGRGLMIVASAVHRTKTAFFILAQSEDGDLYKITVDFVEDRVERLTIKYFDTIPRCASIGILRAGFLFAASESGSHQLYQFENLGDEVEMVEYSSTEENDELVYFQPHEMASLGMVDEIDSLCPMLKSKVLNLTGEQMPQIYSLCGQGARSSLKVVRHGLEVAELAVSELPGNPQAVWTVRRSNDDEHDEYIVVSFLDATLVLSVGEEVEEVTDSGLLTSSPTLCLHRLDGGALLQVTPRAVRHILPDGRVNEWQPPQNREISCSAANTRQVVVTLARSGGQAIYFELDLQTGTLREYDERLAVGSDATCLALSPVSEGQLNASLLAVGCEDDTVRIFSLDPKSCLEPLSMQAVADCAQSVAIASQMSMLTLYVGLRNGLQVRATVDGMSGEIEDSRTQFLGSQAVQLCPIKLRNGDAVVALSTAPWISHVYQGRLRTTPLSYDALTYVSSFSSDQCPEGIVAVAENTLRIMTLDRLDTVLNQATIGLTYTPRDFILNDESKHFAIIEAEHGHYSATQFKQELLARNAVETEEEAEGAVLPPEQFGLVRSKPGMWASLIRVLNPFDGESTQIIELTDNQAAISMTSVQFASQPAEQYLAIGCVRNMKLKPRGCSDASIRIYRWINEGTQLELLHVTAVNEIPQALAAFNGMLAAGLGRVLRLYDLGIKQLLKKAQSVVAPRLISVIRPHPSEPSQLFVGDVQESVQLVAFNQNTHNFHVILDDTLPRYITCMHALDDGDTVVAGDKFGNLFGVRAPESVSKSLQSDPTGNRLIYEKPKMGGAANRWDSIVEYHVGDIITSIETCALAAGGRQVILYTTLLGSVQVAVPFVSQSDVTLFHKLEQQMRDRAPPISGRDHQSYRSAVVPVRAVVDGDLCERYFALDHETREAISDELDRTQQDICKKIEDMRSLFAF